MVPAGYAWTGSGCFLTRVVGRGDVQMCALPPAVHRSIFVVDVAGFGDRCRTNPDQVATREGLYRTLRRALARSGITWDACYREDRGDGAIVLVPPEVPKHRLAALLPVELAVALAEHNAA